MSQSKMVPLVALGVVLLASIVSAQLDFSQCQNAMSNAANKFVDTNRELITSLQSKAQSALGDSVQLDQFNRVMDSIRAELSNMAEHAQAMDTNEMMNSFVKISALQAEVYQLFVNPRFALVMYDTYLEYILQSYQKNTEILSRIPAGCVPSRRIKV